MPSPHLPSTGIANQSGYAHTISLASPDDDIDFVTLHNILYYIYTGCVNLILGKSRRYETLPEGFPPKPDPFMLHRNAEKFLLTKLKDHCFRYLKGTTTGSNVAERLFHPDCEHHDNLREFFFEYFMSHYKEATKSEAWGDLILQKQKLSSSVKRYRRSMLLEITRRVRP